MNNINIIKKCMARKVIVLFIHFTDHFQEEITTAVELVSNYTACSHFNLISDIVTVSYHDTSSISH